MKSKFLLIAVLWSCLIIGALSCVDDRGWGVKIENETISIDEINRYYYIFNKATYNLRTNEEVDKLASDVDNLDPRDSRRQYLIKSNFVDHLIAQKLVYNKAMKDPSVDRKELDAILEMAKIQTVSSFYLGQKFKDRIVVTDAEVEKFYAENKANFRGVPLNDDVIDRIKQQIFFQKSMIASNEYINELMAETRIKKEGFKEYLQKLNKDKSGESKPE